MKIMKAMVIIAFPKKSEIHTVDAIEHDGKWWLAPEWLDYTGQGFSMPVRLVLLDVIPHHRSNGSPEIVVDGPIPSNVLFEPLPSELAKQYVVLERPNIRVPRTH